MIGFVDGLSGVRLSSFTGFTSFSFFSFVAIFGENASHAFQLPFGISGSFFGNAVIIVRVRFVRVVPFPSVLYLQ